MSTRKLPPVVAIDWVDSAGYDGWQSDAAIKELSPTTISTVGFLHAETPTYVTVSATCTHDPDAKRADSPMSIPKCAILRRRTLFK